MIKNYKGKTREKSMKKRSGKKGTEKKNGKDAKSRKKDFEPEKNSNGEIQFPDYPDFRPNLTPKEMFSLGSFGGTY